MKKRILSMLLALTMVMGIFTGCGAGGSAKEITVSEMLNSIIEEKGEVTIYKAIANHFDKDVATLDYKDVYYVYDGKTLTQSNYQGRSTKFKNFQLVTDDKGNVRYEHMEFTLGDYIRFGAFSREEINGTSYMVFALYLHGFDGSKWWDKEVFYTLIEDTEYTIDKTIVFDKASDDITAYVDNATTRIYTWDKDFGKNNNQ